MKQSKIIATKKALDKLRNEKLPLPVAYKLHKLSSKLNPAWEFQLAEEQKLFDEFKPESTVDGGLKFKKPEDAVVFTEKLKELGDVETEIDADVKIQVKMDDRISLTMDDLVALEDFIEFVE